jgi:glycosyltransferase involved in cell wall biosynthesis
MSRSGPLRLLILDEGVLGHRTMIAQLRAALKEDPSIEAHFVDVPPPNRLERLLLRRWRRIGDADLHMLRWRLRWSWRVRRQLRRHLGSVDVALINTQAAALLSRGTMRRLPCVLSIDATIGQFTALEYGGPRDRWSPRQERILARLERRAIEGAAAVVAWTEWNAEALRRECDLRQTQLATIHPGLDADWWSEAATHRPARHEAPLRVLFVGNDVRRKGLDRLIEAIGRLDGEAVLDVVSGDEVEEREAIRVHRGVEARSERLRELYAKADVFALPTRADAVPWAVLEAMAAGLPVIASRVGAIEEMVGDAGEVVEPGDVGELVIAMRRLTDPALRGRLGERALERVRERYDGAVQVPRLVELLSEAAGRPSSARGGPRMRRRTFVALGAGAAGVALAAPYAVLLTDDEFEQLVAARLGIEPKLAGELLKRARTEYGDAEYDARAAAFALAVRNPAAAVLPDSAREKAISGLIEPMLSEPASSLAYAITGSDPGSPACAGLVRRS